MSLRIPDYVDPWRFADLGKKFAGNAPISGFSRLIGLLAETAGEAEYELEGFRDREKRACIRGRVTANLMLTCQRCLTPMELEVDARIEAAAVEGLDEAEALPDYLDPLLVEEEKLSLRDLIEDELILALPQSPVHAAQMCGNGQSEYGPDESDDSTDNTVDADNPFAALAKLKIDKS